MISRSLTAVAVSANLLVPLNVVAVWDESFPTDLEITSAGTYSGDQAWDFQSFSVLSFTPSPTATFIAAGGELIMEETEPGLLPSPDNEPTFIEIPDVGFALPAAGSIVNTGFVDEIFADARVRGDVNVAPPFDGSFSRQGLLARWNLSNDFYAWFIDFGAGTAGLRRQANLPSPELLFSEPIPDFDPFRRYTLELLVIGDTLQGSVFDDKGVLRLTSGEIIDPDPHPRGVSGLIAELSEPGSFLPLQASFANVSSMPEPSAAITLVLGICVFFGARPSKRFV